MEINKAKLDREQQLSLPQIEAMAQRSLYRSQYRRRQKEQKLLAKYQNSYMNSYLSRVDWLFVLLMVVIIGVSVYLFLSSPS